MNNNSSCRISKVEITTDTLTSRGGVALFVKYLQAIDIIALLLEKFGSLKKSRKGVALKNLFLQVLCFFFDGTSRHMNYFDQLQEDAGYAAVLEVPEGQMASSHAMKRFFGTFGVFAAEAFRWVLKQLFVWRLKLNGPKVVELTVDTMVMDNDEALKREGCDPTYKKVKGFQPLHLIWEGKIVDAIFRRGKRHSNYGNDVKKMIRDAVNLIREKYDASVAIVIRIDSGFFDEANFALCDELGIGFIATGKVFDAIKKQVAAIPEAEWKDYDNGRQMWSYARFEYRCKVWDKDRSYRALYTRPQYEEGQQLLEFARPDNIIVTNLDLAHDVLEKMMPELQEYWLEDETIIFHHHQRGADELPHRALKEFGSEELPFKRFAANRAYYYLMVVGFFLFETFKEDNLKDILPMTSYATTIRRKLVDFAAKVVRTGGELILKVPAVIMERLQLATLWTRCQEASPILQT
jgi:Transposase DDE domain group 1